MRPLDTATWCTSAARPAPDRFLCIAVGRSVKPPRREGWRQANSIEQGVDVVLRGMTDIAFELWPVQQLGVAFSCIDNARRVSLDRIDAAPDLHHFVNMVFDESHRSHDLV